MISKSKYLVQIDEGGLYQLAFGKRYDKPGDTAPSDAELTAAIDPAEAQAQGIIKQRFGYLPSDTDFLETATIAGVIYLLSRKPDNKISKEQIDGRRQTFFDMLPASTGIIDNTSAEVQQFESRLGDWP